MPESDMQPRPIADTAIPDEPSERLGISFGFAIVLTFAIDDENRIQFIFHDSETTRARGA